MTTVGEELSTLRNLIREVSDDSMMSQSFLFSIWSRARGQVLFDRHNYEPWNWYRFCVKLKLGSPLDCGPCFIDLPQCKTLISEEKIPSPIRQRHHSNMQVLTVGGRMIGRREHYELRSDMLDPVKKGSLTYSVYNDRLIVWGSKALKVVTVNGIWEDLDTIVNADCEGKCATVYELPSGLGRQEGQAVLGMALQTLNITRSYKDDNIADRNAQTRA